MGKESKGKTMCMCAAPHIFKPCINAWQPYCFDNRSKPKS